MTFNYCCSLFGFLVRVWALLLMLKDIKTKQYGRHAQLCVVLPLWSGTVRWGEVTVTSLLDITYLK